jgi:uncharacterized protein (DUF302 family)
MPSAHHVPAPVRRFKHEVSVNAKLLSALIILSLVACSEQQAPGIAKEASMLLTVDSGKSIETLREDLPRVCEAHKFGVLGFHDLKAKLIEKGQELDRDCLVFEVCNPVKAKEVLENNIEISTALPCRISVFALPDGRTRLATIRPSLLLDLFKTPELKQVAMEVEETMLVIMQEAAG